MGIEVESKRESVCDLLGVKADASFAVQVGCPIVYVTSSAGYFSKAVLISGVSRPREKIRGAR